MVMMVAQPIDDPELGRFTWDQRYKFWLGGIEVPKGNPAYLTIHAGPDERERALGLARDTVARVHNLEPDARRFAAVELLKAHHSDRTVSEPPDVERAVSQMVLNSVAAEANGMLELAYGTDVFFGGVEFIVWFDRDGDRGVTIIDDELSEEEAADPGATPDRGGMQRFQGSASRRPPRQVSVAFGGFQKGAQQCK
jgi:hypothetical protein